jgi:hypothetical protein
MFVRILPSGVREDGQQKQIDETFSLIKYSCLRLSLWLPPSSKSTCLGVRGDVQILSMIVPDAEESIQTRSESPKII